MKESYMEGIANHRGPAPCAKGSASNRTRSVVGDGEQRKLGIELRKHPSRAAGPLACSDRRNAAPALSRGCGRSGGVEDPMRTRMLHAREPGEPGQRPCDPGAGRERPVAYDPDLYASGRSDIGIVPVNPPNKARQRAAEAGEGRPVAKGNQVSRTSSQAQYWNDGLHSGTGCDAPLHVANRYHPRQEPYGVILRVRICAGGAGQPASLPRSSTKVTH